MNQDHEQTIRLLEKALEDARAHRSTSVEIALTDANGSLWLYRWLQTDPTSTLPALVGHSARIH